MKDSSESKELVDHLFRHESGKMIAVLTQVFGLSAIDMIEDIVQDTFIQALQSWRFQGIPMSPSGWLMRTAKNKAIDQLRRKSKWNEIKDRSEFVRAKESYEMERMFLAHEISDSQLRMMFACCHSSLQMQDQVAITLKIVSGLSVLEIARALLSKPATIKQRIIRAKRKLKQLGTHVEIPKGVAIQERLQSVLTILYLLFNEGYYTSSEENWMREDLCMEAMRLTRLVIEHPLIESAEANALMALMCYHASRFDSRMDRENQIILLDQQDRSQWDTRLIKVADYYMSVASGEAAISVYHLEAAIASIHTHSPSVEETDWARLLILYNRLVEHKTSPIVALNRAVVLMYARYLDEAKEVLEDLTVHLKDHHLLHMVKAHYYQQVGEVENQLDELIMATSVAKTQREKEFIAKRIDEIQSTTESSD